MTAGTERPAGTERSAGTAGTEPSAGTGGPAATRGAAVGEPPRWWPSGATRLVGVVGDPIRHSLSPLLHNAAFAALGIDWVSVALRVPAGSGADAVAAVRTLGMGGVSVTMPLKEEVAAAVDELTPVAARLGAVNCVIVRHRRTVGDSTDGDGLLGALAEECHFDPAGASCAVIGAGGAAKAAVDALVRAEASEVVVIGRHPGRASAAAALAGRRGRVGIASDVAGADLVVQATPVGMGNGGLGGPGAGASAAAAAGAAVPIDPGLLHRGQLVVDLVYHPLRTPLLVAAEHNGARTANGLGMLVHQAALAVQRWTGLAPPVEAMAAAVGWLR